MILLTAADLKRLDQWAMNEEKLSLDQLVESAGTISAHHIHGAWKRLGSRLPISIFCGPGNNGADGRATARHLLARGLPAEVYEVDQGAAALGKLNLKGKFVVDAIFGTGLNRKMDSNVSNLIHKINQESRYVVSLDIPSGLNADTGYAREVAVQANETITFTRPKIGFFLEDGPKFVGRIRVEPLSFPSAAIRKIQSSLNLYGPEMARKDLPDRDADGNKFSFGRILIIAGRPGTWGAGLMCASAALQTGAGYVTWAILEDAVGTKIPAEVSLQQPELLTHVITLAEIKKWKRDEFSAVVFGPGLGREKNVQAMLEAILKSGVPLVLDADALSLMGKNLSATLKRFRKKSDAPVILTPHVGELARVLNVASEVVKKDRRGAAETLFNQNTNTVVVAKGFHTLVVGDGGTFVIPSGNSALAKAGSGDVLAGIIAAFLGLGVSSEKAARLSCYLHGLAADFWIKDGNSPHTLQPHQIPAIVEELVQAMFARLKV